MKMRFMTRAARKAGNAARWAEAKRTNGFCTVLSVKCNQCERFVAPDDWNPTSAVCEDCTAYQASRQITIGKPVRWIATGNGKPRRNTAVN